jgi:hypothetical protein
MCCTPIRCLQEQVAAKTAIAEDLDQVGPPLLHWAMICGNQQLQHGLTDCGILEPCCKSVDISGTSTALNISLLS